MQQPLLGAAETLFSPFKPTPKPVVLPQGFDPIPATPEAELGRIVNDLSGRKQAWAKTPNKERAQLLRQCLDTTLEVFEEAADAAARAKGSYGAGSGEDLGSWIPVITGLREYAEACEADGQPSPGTIRRRENGQYVVDAFPQGMEALLWGGFNGELWIQPGKEPTQGKLYRDKAAGKEGEGGVGLVLGAGNQLPVATLDILHKLVVDDEVVVCKMNPVNEYLGPYIRRAFQPFVDKGFLEMVYGGGEVGAYLCNHPLVSSIHLTGSQATYDAIVWQGKLKVGAPPLKKAVGAELGCVTPYIIVPGPWTDADLDYHADTVATGLAQNAGHNCLKAELVLTDAEWPLRDKFLAALKAKLASTTNRVAYYPGSQKKHAAFLKQFPDAEAIGSGSRAADGAKLDSGTGHADIQPSPWFLKTGLSPEQARASQPAAPVGVPAGMCMCAGANTQDENWCGVMQEVAFPGCGGDAGKFLDAVVPYCNDKCWGTLSCAMVIHPTTQKRYRDAYEGAIADLKYGAIAVNCPGLVAFCATKLGWGGYPGTTPQDIGSGNCFVHNTLLFDHVEKSVTRAPWKFHPAPFWSLQNRNSEAVCRLAARFFAGPSLPKMLVLAKEAVRG
ncbi:hypothetical protein N2152v2_011198 [Parachlorella kessleri]